MKDLKQAGYLLQIYDEDTGEGNDWTVIKRMGMKIAKQTTGEICGCAAKMAWYAYRLEETRLELIELIKQETTQ